MSLELSHLHPVYDRLQRLYGDPDLDSIYGAGCTEIPDICFVFMNPTGKNVSSSKTWKGLKAPWIGTKNAWKLFHAVGVLSDQTLGHILSKAPGDWDNDFATQVYQELATRKVYVTNLAKCTQRTSAPVSNKIFMEYLDLLDQEIDTIRPKKIITFGNQVSSLFLGTPVQVSQMRRRVMGKTIGPKQYDVFPVFYPVGQGMRNLPLAIEDIRGILDQRRALTV